jgi:N6-L-threonylcarbamoyladenine synthase
MTKYLLAFDTSSRDIIIKLASFAYDGSKLLSVVSKVHPAPRAANTQLLAQIDAALEQAGVKRSELAAVAVGVTLGSYTGVRIGLATAKGISQALGIPLYGLEVDEERLSPDHLLECFGEIYRLQTGDPGAVLPQYTQMSYAEEAEKKEHPSRYSTAADLNLESKDKEGEGKEDAGRDEALSALSLRRLTPFDLDALHQLASEVDYFKWSAQQYADELHSAKSIWLGAFASDSDGQQRLVAYVGANAAVAEAEIVQVSVDARYRKQGIAQKLLALLFEHLHEKASSSLTLEVRKSNSAAQALYKKLGFAQIASREAYYRDPVEDALILRKELRDWSMGQLPVLGATQAELAAVSSEQEALLLGIETSCDETAAAVMRGTELLSDVVASQVVFHARFGGVVPEIASRKHSEAIVAVVEQALFDAGSTRDPDAAPHTTESIEADALADPEAESKIPFFALSAIVVTDKPGLIGALVVGQAYAKGLSWALQIPLYGINHLEGHLYACIIEKGLEDLPSPHLSLIVSGGHTALVYSPAPHSYETLGETLDDAAGEAFDKVAKVLGLGYPGGPILSKLAEQGNAQAIDFPRALIHSKDYAFSLSGLKTAVITYIRQAEEAGGALNIPDVAASFQQAVVDVQVAKAVRAVRETKVEHFIMAGGVAANKVLREALVEALSKEGVSVHIPPFKYCGDNAAMIVRSAVARLQAGDLQALEFDADCSSSGSLD